MAGGVISLGQDGYYYRPSDTFFSMFGRTIAGLRMLTGQPVLLAETSVGPQVGGVASARQDGQAGGGDGALEHQRGFLFWSWTLAGPIAYRSATFAAPSAANAAAVSTDSARKASARSGWAP